MKKRIAVVIVFLFLLSQICAMSGDGGNVPVKPEKKTEALQVQKEKVLHTENAEQTSNEEPKFSFYNRDERYPIKTIQTSKGDFSYFRSKRGNVEAEHGGVLVFKDMIVKDDKGNELALDSDMRSTGLTVDEFVRHKIDYTYQRDAILEKRGINLKSVARSTRMWYDQKINLDKIDELKENGFDALPESGLGIGVGNLPEIAITSEAIVIGKVVESISQDYEKTGFESKLTIQVDEVLKASENITSSILECWYYSYLGWNNKIALNKPVVISLNNPLGLNKTKSKLLMVSTWFDITEGIVTHNKNAMIENRKKVPLEEFKTKVKNLIEINDAENFYKRDWKEAQK